MPADRTQPARPIARWRLALWGGAALLLAIPAIAMQVTKDVAWGPGDFAVFAAMLAAACGTFEVAVRTMARRTTRVMIALAIAAVFLLIWAQLAVGIW